MSDLADRIAKLAPDRRALLVRELTRTRINGNGARTPENGHSGAVAESDPQQMQTWESFCCIPGAPGRLDALRFRPMARTAPGPGQIQIKARAVSLNFRDLMIAMQLYPSSPGVPSVMGSDYAGEVLACGEGVTEFSPGDRVMGLSAGHFAADGMIVADSHFCAVPNLSAFQAVRIPENLSFVNAAGVPTVFLTSYYALCHVACLARGERVLIHSATGGVGLAAIEIARWAGAEIFATAGSESKRELLAELGIASPMDSRSVEFADDVVRQTGGSGVDVILNTLSGPAVAKGLDILRLFGRFLQIDKQDIARDSPLPLGPFRKGLTFTSIDLSLFLMQPARLKQIFVEIADHLRLGHFAPVRTTVFPVAKLGDAMGLMSRYKHIGKLVLSYDV
jgi:phthiocerol/phenolphthiocerol synthesis type-I polyketide synthase C